MAALMEQLSTYPISTTSDTVDAIGRKIAEVSALDHMMILGYEIDDRIVGTCTVGRLEGVSKGCRPFAVIENVVVLDSVRRKGIGTLLVRRAIDQAEAWNCYKVILETGSKKEGTLTFYEECDLTRGGKTAFMKRFGA